MSQVQQTQTDVPNDAAENPLVQSAIQEISHIATLPEVTMKIIKLVEDPDSTAQDLNNVISNDPALGARILKVVNSAFYGLPGQIGSINRAIVLLGLNAVKNIAIAASLAKLFRGGKIAPNFDARDLWVHSIATATATRMLAQKIELSVLDEAFLAGLIHDIGIMVEVQACRPKFVEVTEKLQNDESLTLRQAEMDVIGADHQMFGQGLCAAWKFPSSFRYVTGFHHNPMELSGNNRTLASLVHIAEVIVKRGEFGSSIDVETDTYNPDVLADLGLTEAQCQQVLEGLSAAVDDAKGIFNDAA